MLVYLVVMALHFTQFVKFLDPFYLFFSFLSVLYSLRTISIVNLFKHKAVGTFSKTYKIPRTISVFR